MKRTNTTAIILCIAVLPSMALADAGTPLMWAGMLHLAIGNLLIGILEGYLLARIFALRRGRTIGLLIGANYFSAWIGGLFVNSAIMSVLPMDLNNIWFLFWAMVVFTYLLTLVLEFPFVALSFRRDPAWLKKAIRGSLIIQTVSYVLLFGWYWLASGTSLLTKTEVVRSSTVSLPRNVVIYYIASNDGNVYMQALDTPGRIKVLDLRSTNDNDRLFVRSSPADDSRWDLMARIATADSRCPKIELVRKDFAAEAAPSWCSLQPDPRDEDGTWFNFGWAARLGSATNSSWSFRSGFWPIEGLLGSQTNTGMRVGFSFETPFGAWNVRNVTLLPGDDVLFQLGRNQVCVFDPMHNQVALLAKGRGPIAVLREGEKNLTATAGSHLK